MAISISEIVNVRPRLITAGQTGLELNGMFLSENLSIPVGGVLGFTDANSVGSYFGGVSDEYTAAAQYFKGFDGSLKSPPRIYFARWVSEELGAAPFIRTAPLGLTLDGLKEVNGTLIFNFSGIEATITVNFASVTSFSAAATQIEQDLRAAVEDDLNFNDATVEYDSLLDAFIITGGEKGAPKTITYVTGTAAALLKLTQATGAVLSQGAAKETPSVVMDNILKVTDNFASFSTLTGVTDELNLAFDAWADGKDIRFLYVVHSVDANLLIPGNTNNIGSKLIEAGTGSACAVYGDARYTAFIMGSIASIDYTRANGAITLSFKRSAGLPFNVAEPGKAAALREKGFNYCGDYSENNLSFRFFYPGSMYGDYSWIDTYINAVWLNARIQLSLIQLLASIKRISYNSTGYGIIASALQSPLSEALNTGVCEKGVELSSEQKQTLNLEAGFDLASVLFADGYYIQVWDPGAAARAARLTPVIDLWYVYGGAVQKLTVNSTLVE